MKISEIIKNTLDKLRNRPYSNEYIANQIENELNEQRFKWIQEQNSITLAIKAAKYDETIPKSNR
jgi:hypothetical protein